jgi:spore coat-associated protein N
LIGARVAIRRRRRTVALLWLAAATLATGGLAMSLAVFARQEAVDQTFSVGTVSLGVAPAGTLLTFAGMVPGNEVDGVLTIQNEGTGDLRYAMTVAATDPDAKHLRDVLQLDVERGTGCSGPVLEVLYSGPIATAAFGDPTAGGDPGDRPLGSGGSEVLCFRATLPLGADSQLQGATTSATLTFRAEQVSGNP